MSSITFEQFKSYFEFALEVSGVVGGIGAVIYKVDGLKAIWKVARGRANSADQTLALEVLQDAGGFGDQALREIANRVQRKNQGAADRLNGLRSEANRAPSRDQSQSPGQMV